MTRREQIIEILESKRMKSFGSITKTDFPYIADAIIALDDPRNKVSDDAGIFMITEDGPEDIEYTMDKNKCRHPLKYKLANDIRYYCPDCGSFLYENIEQSESKSAEIPETILRKHIAEMKITNKLWYAIIEAMEEYRQQPGESKSDPIRRFFERANMVLLGDYSNHISESQWKIIQTAMTDIEKRTGLMTIATEFYVDGNLDDEKMAQPKEDERSLIIQFLAESTWIKLPEGKDCIDIADKWLNLPKR